MTTQDLKSKLRSKKLQQIKTFATLHTDQAKKESLCVCKKIVSFNNFLDCDIVFSYMPLKYELDVYPIFEFCVAHNKEFALPRVQNKNGKMDFFFIDPLKPLENQLVKGNYGIKEPNENCKIFCLDNPTLLKEKKIFVIAPGVAFSKQNTRLGKGGGFYDRYLFALKQQGGGFFACGVGFNMQIVNTLPHNINDFTLDAVFTAGDVL